LDFRWAGADGQRDQNPSFHSGTQTRANHFLDFRWAGADGQRDQNPSFHSGIQNKKSQSFRQINESQSFWGSPSGRGGTADAIKTLHFIQALRH
jgi:hypothetical protein